MKKTRIIPLLLAALMLTACSAPSEPAPGDVLPDGGTAPIVSSADIGSETAAPEAQPLSDGSAGGNIAFYVNDAPVFAGMNLSRALTEDIICPDDLDLMLEPGQFSGVLRLEYPSEGGSVTLFAVVANTFSQPTPVRQCTIYSLSAHDGCAARIGEGGLVSGQSKVSDVIAAYGEPTKRSSGEDVDILVYHKPLSTLTFTANDGVVRQAAAYHIADRYQSEIGACGGLSCDDIPSLDGFILLSRYLDVQPYISGETGPSRDVSTTIHMYGEDFTLGCTAEDLPEEIADRYLGLPAAISPNESFRLGLAGEAEFLLYNSSTLDFLSRIRKMTVLGTCLTNPSYSNFGVDNSGHPSFSYMELTNEDGIERVLDTLGLPTEITAACDGRRGCAWLRYIAENGDSAAFKADLFTGELIELRVLQFNENVTDF